MDQWKVWCPKCQKEILGWDETTPKKKSSLLMQAIGRLEGIAFYAKMSELPMRKEGLIKIIEEVIGILEKE